MEGCRLRWLQVLFVVTAVSLASYTDAQSTTYMTLFNNGVLTGQVFGSAQVQRNGFGYLQLTGNQAAQQGAALLAVPPVQFPTLSFRILIGGGPENGGEGFALSYGRSLFPAPSSGWYRGLGSDLIISFKSISDSNGPPGIVVRTDGISSSPALSVPWDTRQWNVDVTVQFDPPDSVSAFDSPQLNTAYLSVIIGTDTVISRYLLTDWNPTPDYNMALSASTGRYPAQDNHRFDLVRIAIPVPSVMSGWIVYGGDSRFPQFLWFQSTLRAAAFCARGPPFSIQVKSAKYRVGRPRGRRLQQLSTDVTVSVEIAFVTTGGADAGTLATRVNNGMLSGDFSSAFLNQFNLLASLVAAGSTKPTGSITATNPPAGPTVSGMFAAPALSDYFKATNVVTSKNRRRLLSVPPLGSPGRDPDLDLTFAEDVDVDPLLDGDDLRSTSLVFSMSPPSWADDSDTQIFDASSVERLLRGSH